MFIAKLLYLFFIPLEASVPNMEGILRNANSAALDRDIVDLKLSIESYSKVFLRVFIDASHQEVLIKKYRESESDDHLYGIVFKKFDELQNDVPSIFIALLIAWTTQNSTPLAKILKDIDPSFLLNEEAINKNKNRLLHCKLLSLKEGLEDPYISTDPAKEREIRQTLQSPFYHPSSLKIVRDGDYFYWAVELDHIKAYFDNETHALRKLSLADLSLTAGPYIFFDKKFFLPKQVTFESASDHSKVLFMDMQNYNKSSSLSEEASSVNLPAVKETIPLLY